MAYPYKAEQFLSEAQENLQRMKSARNPSEFRQAFLSFLNASRFVFQAWNKDFKNLDGFVEWWQAKALFLESDELCKFFRNLRNDVIKVGKDPFGINQEIKGPLTLHGPLQIGSQGILKGTVENGRAKWIPMDVPGVKTKIRFHDAPEKFINLNPIQLCEHYLEILKNIVDEFVIRFPGN